MTEQSSSSNNNSSSTAATDKTILAQAQDKLGSAVDTTVSAVKDHPVAAAAIAGGVAAAVAGAAFGVSKLREGDSGSKSKSKSKN